MGLTEVSPHGQFGFATKKKLRHGILLSAQQRTAAAMLPIFVLGVFAPSRALADADDTFNVTAGYSLQTDDNFFRLPSSAAAPNELGTKSEQIRSATLGLNLDKSYSLQRFRLNTTVVDSKYKNFGFLDFQGLNYSGTWNFSITPRVRGTLYADRKQALNSFADFQVFSARNVRTDATESAEVEADLGAAFRLLGRVSQVKRTNELPVLQDGDSTTNSAALGVRYVFPSGNSVSYQLRQGSGDYYNRVQDLVTATPNSFDEREHELKMVWALTGKTSLNARLAHLQRTHDTFPQRDFGGVIGDLGLTWNATGKISIAASFARTLNAYQTNNSNYVTGNRLTLSPVWNATAHTRVRLGYSYFSQDYNENIGTGNARSDISRGATVGVDWTPLRNVALSLSLQNQKRSSNVTGQDYTSNSATVGAQVNF